MSIYIAHRRICRKAAVRLVVRRSSASNALSSATRTAGQPGHCPQPAHTGLGGDLTVGWQRQSAVGVHLCNPSLMDYYSFNWLTAYWDPDRKRGMTASSGHPEIPLALDCGLYVTSHDSIAGSIKTLESSDPIPDLGRGSPLPRRKYLLDSFVNAYASCSFDRCTFCQECSLAPLANVKRTMFFSFGRIFLFGDEPHALSVVLSSLHHRTWFFLDQNPSWISPVSSASWSQVRVVCNPVW